MKIAVTTIAKNEEQHVERWAKSALDADLLFIADTGSSDRTVEAARDCGVSIRNIRINPWRFDDARNAGLALLPEDIDVIITLDMDEVLQPGWREALEKAPKADQYSYHYHWSPEVYFHGDRCHSRYGFRWKHPVHEVLVQTQESITKTFGGFTIEHLPDDSKSRGQYLDLLRLATEESPSDDRLAHYYGRELYFRGDWATARRELVRHLSISTWAPERAQSYRYLAEMDDYPERWILKALSEDPNRREPWIDLIKLYKRQGRPVDSLVDRTLTITQRPVDYMTEAQAWDDNYVRSLA